MGSLQYAGQYISIHALREEGDAARRITLR